MAPLEGISDSSRLGYRAFFSVPRDLEPDPVGAAEAQFNSWLRGGHKGYDIDALVLDQQVEIADGVTASIVKLEDRDGSITFRGRVTEARADKGTWDSVLTVHVPGRPSDAASVLLDISGPIRPRTPRLAKLLTGALPARDSLTELTERPVIISGPDVDEVVELICDPDRRGLLFVAGMTADLPYDKWYSLVSELLKETTGLAGSYFLDPVATDALRKALGPTHAVGAGTVRTFLSGADPASELDALRHRFLSTDRIVRDPSHRLALVLGRRAQEETLQAALPSKMRRVQRQVAEHIDRLLLKPISEPDAIPEPDPVDATSSPVSERPPLDLEPASATGVLETMAQRAKAMFRRVLGVEEPSDQDWDKATELALRGKGAEATEERVARQLSQLRDELEEREERRLDFLKRLQDEQLEHYATSEQLDSYERRNAYLEDLLRRTELAGELYADADQEHPPVPGDFVELLSGFGQLAFVDFTGDADVTLRLDQHDPLGVWAGKAWKVLCALEDYARASSDGRCSTDVEGYLRNLPEGCRGYSANKHAPTESEDVQKNPRLREARVLPVPPSVVAQGKVEMMAHFKIAQSGLISPRLHYYDDTVRSGKVYVGHLGEHLPTKRTN